jgi:hypothetical protein
MPIGECIAHMAPNTATEDALLELYMTLSLSPELECSCIYLMRSLHSLNGMLVLHSGRVILFHVGLL